MESNVPLHLVCFPVPSLVIVVSTNKIIFYNITNDIKSFISIPDISTDKLEPENDSEDSFSDSEESSLSNVFIKDIHCFFTEKIKLIAIADSFKRVFIYEYPSNTILFSTRMPKAITKVLVSPDHQRVLVGDKFGDLYSMEISLKTVTIDDPHLNSVKNPYLLLGHISILTDIVRIKLFIIDRWLIVPKNIFIRPKGIKKLNAPITHIPRSSKHISWDTQNTFRLSA